jgi:hypothetical protein
MRQMRSTVTFGSRLMVKTAFYRRSPKRAWEAAYMSEQHRTASERKQEFVVDAIRRYGDLTDGSLLSALIDRVLTLEARLADLEARQK